MEQIADITAVSAVLHSFKLLQKIPQRLALSVRSADIVRGGIYTVSNTDNIHKGLVRRMLSLWVAALFVIPQMMKQRTVMNTFHLPDDLSLINF